MRSIIISSNCSGGGKTTFTLGLMKVLKSRNFHVQGYKVGPDYIDTAFHKAVTGIASRNLDTFLMGEEGVKKSFQKGSGNIGIIEGVMGLYDGIGASEKGSTYHVSKLLGNMPIVLVLSPKGQSASICAEISGFKNYKDANIVGVVLNSVSEKYYNLLKYAIEKNCNIKVFGYIPKTPEIALSSRHLGLVQSMEILNLEGKLSTCANLMERYVDIDGIINATQEYKISTDGDLNNSFKADDKQKKFESLKEESRNRNLKIGVALDKAFSFYYKDNLEALENLGEIVYFSPINDKELPKNLDFLYIGGGYPEVFKKELENNYSMRKSIKEALDSGLRCYAECGGLMYLTQSIDASEMVGFFHGDSTMTNKLQNFGYCKVKIDNKCFDNRNLEDNEFEINAHEFHKSKVDLDEENVYEVEKTLYNGEVLKWKCGYFKNNTLGGYAHINFIGNEELLKALVNFL
ncbi:cobyrinate a,c-diamide synthase [Clostridium beijerinckii]|uniref:Cobyrinate a,c-diamide synthase n=1 Tax=Clostridium beijerinckii TaxID=1520 RepID=A0AAX0AXR7_CLOBE|nr:cobyrinate a,c-diamide synthase [Clostridium beijerinckii]MBA8935100.1 cobyrinic acid a,c-diamide synthase [Clostridium beijerinckii]NRT34785.1 cobyrinic acid a,c-diamide synthase [Clostridium beijerinckii]NRT45786.1 cobyrinic acid a,c-diamide synthase [Clostridium beijerinckii]NRT71476.1 cobyrinic acid a,c-diamide synthase [Clostridium beijerinckii]NRT87870.1 cobyrinic acid a,c-diamide synthase [Clostridium beijerinckii]